MHKILIIYCILIVSILSCTDEKTPKTVAEKFIKAFYTYDFKTAKELSTDEGIRLIDDFKLKSAYIKPELKEQTRLNQYVIDEKNIVIKNAEALVLYQVVKPDGRILPDPIQKFELKLVKINDEWKANYTLEEFKLNYDEKMNKIHSENTDSLNID